jgi:hypothetical protein
MLLVYAQSVLVRSIEVVYIGMGAARNTTRYSMLISKLYRMYKERK